MDLGGLLQSLPLQDALLTSGICLLVIGGLVLSLLIAIWVYRDAESRGMSGVLWLIVVLVAGLIGLLIYLIVRGDHPVRPPGYYPAAYPAYPVYYPPAYPPPAAPAPPPSASTPAVPAGATVTCKSCGGTSPVGARFCRHCGAPM